MSTQTRQRHVTIIGAGIVGMACAVNLKREGYGVTVVDRLPPGEGCSFGNAGVMASGAIVPLSTPGFIWKIPGMWLDPMGPLSFRWGHLPRMLPWLYRFLRSGSPEKVAHIADALAALMGTSAQDHLALAADTPAREFVKPSPYVYVFKNEQAFAKEAESWRMRRERGVTYEELRGGEVREFEPALSSEYGHAVVLENHGYASDPSQLVKALAEHFVRQNGIVLQREVKDIEIGAEGPVRLLTDDEPIAIDSLVVAAGAWSGELAKRLGSPVPLESERGYHVTIQNSGIDLRCPIACDKFVATPMEPGLRIAGLVDFGGLHGPPNFKRVKTLVQHGKRLLPALDTSSYTEWMGHRPSLPDSLPVIDRSPHFANVYYAFGHQHLGITGGPKTGRVIADLIGGREPEIDLEPFRVNRF